MLYTEGADLYERRVPPGFRDQDKPEPDRYGDLVLWRQLLLKAAELKTPAIFITDDIKEDWWYRVNGKTHGPRVELIDEYFDASGERIHFYTPQRFADFAPEKLEIAVSSEFVSEIHLVSRERDRTIRSVLKQEREMLLMQQRDLMSLLEGTGVEPGPSEMIEDQRIEQEHVIDRIRKRLAELDSEHAAVLSALVEAPASGEYRDGLDRHFKFLEFERMRQRNLLDQESVRLERYTRESMRRRSSGNSSAHDRELERRILALNKQLRETELLLGDLGPGYSH